MEAYFNDLSSALYRTLPSKDKLFCWFSGERSDFVRFNEGKIRQAGSVDQAIVKIQLFHGQRQATAEQTLTGNLDTDCKALSASLEELRTILEDLPDDPFLLFNPEPLESRMIREGKLPPAPEMAAEVVMANRHRDLVGFLASGPIYRGLSSSLGHRCWHEVTNFLLDYSVYLRDDQAIKDSLAGFSWDSHTVRKRLEDAAQRLDLLARPVCPIRPGRYRVYLAPAALSEIFGLLGWSAFSAKALRTKQSPLVRLQEGEQVLSSKVTLQENIAEGLAPAFQGEGFARPGRLPLIEAGRFAGSLVSPRTAREYGTSTNGASSGEVPEALDMAGGDLPQGKVLQALGTGLWVNHLWYLNYSDRGAGRMTGMTRFATFWVEGGEIMAPTPAMRFDDSLYDLFGKRLEALTVEREFFPEPTTYGERQTASVRLPGALIDGLTLTL
ncbi:MAG: TldD/PmbA family protein [Myxococcales bacterium]|nr:TldD/PmbA family protein [Polyangiaceae bacterium]MDW8249250.1 TldD/PmbA family protein [Myxococcales bacterium]